MGCWNGTCGLTNLPIMHGDEMYVFPIVDSYRDSFCYSTALYRPSVLPFRAAYNDYGGGEDCGGVGLDILMEGIKEKLVELEVGENQYHDIAVKREGFNVDTFFDACHKKRLQFQNPLRGYKDQPQTKDVFFTMIRKDVADRLWTDWTFDQWKPSGMKTVPEGFESDQYYIKNVTYAKLAELIPEYLEQCFERFSNNINGFIVSPEDDEKQKALNNMIFANSLCSFFGQEYNERDHLLSGIFSHIFSSNYSDGGFAKIGEVDSQIIALYMEDRETAYTLMRECLIGYMINDYMSHVRKVWMPPMHQGCQSECLAEYKLLNSIVNDVIVEREKEYYGDEDE